MATVAQLLEQKGHRVETIAPGDAVYNAIKRMSELDILSIGDLVRSIVAEQDIAISQLEQYIHRG